MKDKRAVQAHVLGYMQAHNLTESQLARQAGIPQATLNRMLADNPSYRGQVDAWRQLAAYAPLGLDAVEVLAAVGLGAPSPIVLEPVPPLQQIERALHAGPWKPEVRAAVFTILKETAQLA